MSLESRDIDPELVFDPNGWSEHLPKLEKRVPTVDGFPNYIFKFRY